jgi:DNA polymerase V
MKPIAAAKLVPVQFYPLYGCKINAGFPSPADDYIESQLDLNERFVKHKAATFFIRVKGDSMREANIHDSDLLIVDKAAEPKHGDIVVAEIDGEFTVKRLYKRGDVVKLQAANEAYPEILIKPGCDLVVWGVVQHVVHTFG